MRITILLGIAPLATAFVPSHNTRRLALHRAPVSRNLVIDPSLFHDRPQHLDSLRDAFTSSSLTLSDALDAVASSAASSNLSPEDAAAAQAAVDAANNNGWFGFLTGPIEGLLQLIHSTIVSMGVSADAWGVSIVALTVLIKVVTFPLTKSQLESTNKMQALQPTIKAIQEKYASNQEVMNQKIAETYQVNEVNPLAGCIPSLVQIPVFIGLYRAVFTLARDDKLNEPFLWLPNLEGPTYGADPTHGSDWILQGWNNGVPSLGWEDTIAFMILPLVLVISQYLSMEIMQPKDSPQQNNFILKLLPLMIGWFSLTVPAALSIYWVTNNIITTATNVIIKNSMAAAPVTAGGTTASTTTSSSSSQPSTIFAPPRQKPSGFSASTPMFRDDEVKPITAIDAEILKKRDTDEDDDDDDEDDDDAMEGSKSESVTSASAGTGMDAADKKGGTDKKKKRKKRKN